MNPPRQHTHNHIPPDTITTAKLILHTVRPQLLAMSCRTTYRDERNKLGPSSPSALSAVASELEALRRSPSNDGEHFPTACRQLLMSLPGNGQCFDCRDPRPEWANVSYGILLCVQCSGRHRSHGVQNSRVRSIDMDAWNQPQILAMLEGGNDQLGGFFGRHRMTDSAKIIRKRYMTKASLFYRSHLQKHVQQVVLAGVYQGREVARQRSLSPSPSSEVSESSSVSSTTATNSSDEERREHPADCAQPQGIPAN